MARPLKKGVDYFPHDITHGKTLFVLEQRWGNDGYAVWFKLLEALGSEAEHYLDLRDEATMLHLSAKCRVSTQILREILSALATMGAISSELWFKSEVIWSQNFVDRVADAYRLRKTSPPSYPHHLSISSEETTISTVETSENGQLSAQSRLNKNKEDNKPPIVPHKLFFRKVHEQHFRSMPGGIVITESHLQAFNLWEQKDKTPEEVEQAYIETAGAKSTASRFKWICDILSGKSEERLRPGQMSPEALKRSNDMFMAGGE